MKAIYINPFIKATIEVIKVMSFLTVRASKPYLKKTNVASGDVSTIVGMTGQSTGTFSISFESKSILMIATKMFGEEMTELNHEVHEVAGELANMISGKARQEIEGLGLLLDGAIPSVFAGKNHNIFHHSDGPIIAIPFNIEGAAFTMEVCFEF